jgi:hypothetical protein
MAALFKSDGLSDVPSHQRGLVWPASELTGESHAVEHTQFVGIDAQVSRCHIFFEVFDFGSSGNGQDDRRPRQQPGEGHL